MLILFTFHLLKFMLNMESHSNEHFLKGLIIAEEPFGLKK